MRPGSSSGVPADGTAAAAAAAVAEAAPMRLETVRVPLSRAAALMIAGASKLRELIADTEASRAMLSSVIAVLAEALFTIDHLFLGPLPGPIAGARRTSARLCGAVPPAAAYPQIDQCRVHLERLGAVFAAANAGITRCAETLRFADESPQWQRWRHLMALGAGQATEAGEKLFEADALAGAAYFILLDLVRSWDRLAGRLGRLTEMTNAERKLRDARELMEEALAAMRQLLDVVSREANVMIIILGKNEASASSASSAARRDRTIRAPRRGTGRLLDCKCM